MFAYIIEAIRTPRARGKNDGKLFEVAPVTLLSGQLEALRDRVGLDPAVVDDVIVGCGSQVGEQGANIARAAVFHAGWDPRAPGTMVNRCGASGLEAVHVAAAKILGGQDHLVVAAGVESMSRGGRGSEGGAWAFDPKTHIRGGFMPQGLGADLLATVEDFSRKDIDQWALWSHQRAAKAQAQGFFKNSIVPVRDQNGLEIITEDEMIRRDTSLEALGFLEPCFVDLADRGYLTTAQRRYPDVEKISHVHTAGNSAASSDGASAVLLASEAAVKKYGWKPRARVVSMATGGSEPTMTLAGTVPATQKALERAKLSLDAIDLFEVNEDFASVVLKFARDLRVPFEKINVNGGAIALGHPRGATGAILVSTLIDELGRQRSRYGLVTLCGGAGMGLATVLERL